MINKLKGYRTMAGYTQEKIAKQLEITRSAYVQKELGNRRLGDIEKDIIFNLLKKEIPNLSYDELF